MSGQAGTELPTAMQCALRECVVPLPAAGAFRAVREKAGTDLRAVRENGRRKFETNG